ncbi:MAG: hypothetical protein M1818_003403 [Claussenomyces sp. TS43310]|nr:MAG: hypothetical protein M1818_003403 [Claussenomyces sp. TS43310]
MPKKKRVWVKVGVNRQGRSAFHQPSIPDEPMPVEPTMNVFLPHHRRGAILPSIASTSGPGDRQIADTKSAFKMIDEDLADLDDAKPDRLDPMPLGLRNNCHDEENGSSSKMTNTSATHNGEDADQATSDTMQSMAAMTMESSTEDMVKKASAQTDAVLPSAILSDTIKRLELEQSGKLVKDLKDLNQEMKRFKKECRKGRGKACGCPICYTRPSLDHGPRVSDVTALHPLTDQFIVICKNKGLDLSAEYASARLNLNNGKIVFALDSARADLEAREKAIELSGRVDLKREQQMTRGTHFVTRDQIIRYIEDDDKNLIEFRKHGPTSFYGKSIKSMHPDQVANIELLYTQEAQLRESRANYYRELQSLVRRRKMTIKTFDEKMRAFDNLHSLSEVGRHHAAESSGTMAGVNVSNNEMLAKRKEANNSTALDEGREDEKGKGKEEASEEGDLRPPCFERPSLDWSRERMAAEMVKIEAYASYLRGYQQAHEASDSNNAELTDIETQNWVWNESDEQVVRMLRGCGLAEAARHRHLIKCYNETVGARYTSEEPDQEAMDHYALECPWIQDEDRARAEIQVFGGSGSLAASFELKRQIWLGSWYGNGVFFYSDEEAMRFVAAVKYKLPPGDRYNRGHAARYGH